MQGRPGAVLRQARRRDLQLAGLRRRVRRWAATPRRSSSASASCCASPTPSTSTSPPRCSAPASRPTPRSALGRRHRALRGRVGVGGLGHMGVKIAAATGCRRSPPFASSQGRGRPRARCDATRAPPRTPTRSEAARALRPRAQHGQRRHPDRRLPADCSSRRRHVVNVGAAAELRSIPSAFSLIGGTTVVAGSQIGGIAQTQEMLEFCAEHGIARPSRSSTRPTSTPPGRVSRRRVRYRGTRRAGRGRRALALAAAAAPTPTAGRASSVLPDVSEPGRRIEVDGPRAVR